MDFSRAFRGLALSNAASMLGDAAFPSSNESQESTGPTSGGRSLLASHSGAQIPVIAPYASGHIGTALSSEFVTPEGSFLGTAPETRVGTSKKGTAMLLLATMFGSGVLVLPGAFASLGWCLGAACLLTYYCVSLFVSYMLSKLRLAYTVPLPVTLGDIFAYHFGLAPGYIGWGVLFIACMQVVCIYTLELLNVVRTLVGDLKGRGGWGDETVVVPVSVALLLLLPNQYRRLRQLTLLSLLSVVSIIFVLVVFLFTLLGREAGDCEQGHGGGRESVGPTRAQLTDALTAVAQISFAFNGQAFFLDIQSEMAEPARFVDALMFAYLVILVLYAVLATLSWGHCGETTPQHVSDALVEFGEPHIVVAASVALALHIVGSYAIIQQVLAREAAIWCLPGALAPGWRGRLKWLAITLGQLGFAMAVVQYVPHIFSVLDGLGIMVSAQTFVFPCVLYLACRRRQQLLQGRALDLAATSACSIIVLGTLGLLAAGILCSIEG